MRIQSAIGHLRNKLFGLTAKEFAEKLRKAGCSSMTVGRLRKIERGTLHGTELERKVIAKFLNVESGDLKL